MATITIRNIPEHTHAELAARAARRGQSLQEFLLEFLTQEARRITPEDLANREPHDSADE